MLRDSKIKNRSFGEIQRSSIQVSFVLINLANQMQVRNQSALQKIQIEYNNDRPSNVLDEE